MTVRNTEVAGIFREVADLLEIDGANPFRVRAYREAAATIERMGEEVADRVEDGDDLTGLSGIGEDLAEKIEEIVATGASEQLEELRERVPPGLAELLDLPGLGAERVRDLADELGVEGLDDLEAAAEGGRVREVEGFGEALEKKILEGIEELREGRGRWLLAKAEPAAEALVEALSEAGAGGEVLVAGSLRRRRPTVGDLDLLAVSDDPGTVLDRFCDLDGVDEVAARGENRATVRLRSGLEADLWVVPEDERGSAFFHATGARPHNLALRRQARERDWKLNEYGLFDAGGERLAGASEEELYEAFDLAWIPPELREDQGEVEAARDRELPELVTLDDLRGDLQSHTDASDGRATLEEMARAAAELGHRYLAVTDHGEGAPIPQQLDRDGLARQGEEIDELAGELDGLTLLKGVEVEILEDGSLGLPDAVLEDLEVVVAGLHSHFDLSRDRQTERILRAMEDHRVHLLAHPTGRRLGQRPPIELDWERLLESAAEHRWLLEIDGQPDRLDLPAAVIRQAKEAGVPMAVDSDAHSPGELRYLRHGVDQARRGWLEPDDVVNARGLEDLRDLLARRD